MDQCEKPFLAGYPGVLRNLGLQEASSETDRRGGLVRVLRFALICDSSLRGIALQGKSP